jgi:hypothetical protein
MSISNKIKAWWKKINHKCTPMKYPPTGETMIFHWDVNWFFSQTFTVCKECKKVKVLSEIENKDRIIPGQYMKEKDGEQWSKKCSFAKVPSIGRNKLIID